MDKLSTRELVKRLVKALGGKLSGSAAEGYAIGLEDLQAYFEDQQGKKIFIMCSFLFGGAPFVVDDEGNLAIVLSEEEMFSIDNPELQDILEAYLNLRIRWLEVEAATAAAQAQ